MFEPPLAIVFAKNLLKFHEILGKSFKRRIRGRDKKIGNTQYTVKNKCNFTSNVVAAELPLLLL